MASSYDNRQEIHILCKCGCVFVAVREATSVLCPGVVRIHVDRCENCDDQCLSDSLYMEELND